MPELAEVEHARGMLERILVGRTLIGVECSRDEIVFDGADGPARVREALLRRRVLAAKRHGKYAWLVLDRGPHPIFHLGMTGQLRTVGDEPLRLASSPQEIDRAWPPRFWKIRLRTEQDEVVMTNARRLGRVLLRDDPRGEAPIARLGFDPWTELPCPEDFEARLARRKRSVIKGLLLNQAFAAGVGNWVADEVLYQAEIDPRRRVESLSRSEVARLREKLRYVVQVAVEADARKDRFPRGWLFHHRWGKQAAARTAAGEAIEHLTISGRTTAWVPSRQR